MHLELRRYDCGTFHFQPLNNARRRVRSDGRLCVKNPQNNPNYVLCTEYPRPLNFAGALFGLKV